MKKLLMILLLAALVVVIVSGVLPTYKVVMEQDCAWSEAAQDQVCVMRPYEWRKSGWLVRLWRTE